MYATRLQYVLGQLFRSIIGYWLGDVIMAATSQVEAAEFGTRTTGIKHI